MMDAHPIQLSDRSARCAGGGIDSRGSPTLLMNALIA
jgi:hypothetical protein